MSAKPTVWKFKVEIKSNGFFEIECQANATPVMFGLHDPSRAFSPPAVWMELNPAQTQRKTYKFKIVGTGQDIPPSYYHVHSMRDGVYVWHLYQEK